MHNLRHVLHSVQKIFSVLLFRAAGVTPTIWDKPYEENVLASVSTQTKYRVGNTSGIKDCAFSLPSTTHWGNLL